MTEEKKAPKIPPTDTDEIKTSSKPPQTTICIFDLRSRQVVPNLDNYKENPKISDDILTLINYLKAKNQIFYLITKNEKTFANQINGRPTDSKKPSIVSKDRNGTHKKDKTSNSKKPFIVFKNTSEAQKEALKQGFDTIAYIGNSVHIQPKSNIETQPNFYKSPVITEPILLTSIAQKIGLPEEALHLLENIGKNKNADNSYDVQKIIEKMNLEVQLSCLEYILKNNNDFNIQQIKSAILYFKYIFERNRLSDIRQQEKLITLIQYMPRSHSAKKATLYNGILERSDLLKYISTIETEPIVLTITDKILADFIKLTFSPQFLALPTVARHAPSEDKTDNTDIHIDKDDEDSPILKGLGRNKFISILESVSHFPKGWLLEHAYVYGNLNAYKPPPTLKTITQITRADFLKFILKLPGHTFRLIPLVFGLAAYAVKKVPPLKWFSRLCEGISMLLFSPLNAYLIAIATSDGTGRRRGLFSLLVGTPLCWGGLLALLGGVGYDALHLDKLVNFLDQHVFFGHLSDLANSIGFYPGPTATVLALFSLALTMAALHASGMLVDTINEYRSKPKVENLTTHDQEENRPLISPAKSKSEILEQKLGSTYTHDSLRPPSSDGPKEWTRDVYTLVDQSDTTGDPPTMIIIKNEKKSQHQTQDDTPKDGAGTPSTFLSPNPNPST